MPRNPSAAVPLAPQGCRAGRGAAADGALHGAVPPKISSIEHVLRQGWGDGPPPDFLVVAELPSVVANCLADSGDVGRHLGKPVPAHAAGNPMARVVDEAVNEVQ